MKNRYLLGAGIPLGLAFGGAQAQAQMFGPFPPGAFYLGPEGGWTKLFSQTPGIAVQGPRGVIVTPQVQPTVNYNGRSNADARLGYAWGPWRFEEEYSYRNNSVSSGSFANATGSAHSNAIMTNAIYDFTLGWPLTPHIGAGIGAVNVFNSIGGSDTVTTSTGGQITFTSPTISASHWSFGYQAIAGI